jgi:hypothetical protein
VEHRDGAPRAASSCANPAAHVSGTPRRTGALNGTDGGAEMLIHGHIDPNEPVSERGERMLWALVVFSVPLTVTLLYSILVAWIG